MKFKNIVAGVVGVGTVLAITLGAIFMPAIAITFGIIGLMTLGIIFAPPGFWAPRRSVVITTTPPSERIVFKTTGSVVSPHPSSVLIPVAYPKPIRVIRTVPSVVVHAPKPVRVVHTTGAPVFVSDLPVSARIIGGVTSVIQPSRNDMPLHVQAGDRVIKVMQSSRNDPPIHVAVGSSISRAVQRSPNDTPASAQFIGGIASVFSRGRSR